MERALFLKVLDDPVKMGIYYRRGKIADREDTTFKKDEAALLSTTFALLAEADQDPYQLIFDSAAFPAAPVGLQASEPLLADAPAEPEPVAAP